MKKELDVVTYGEAMAMFVATETGELHDVCQFIKRAAGAELNVSIGLARLGLNVGWLSRVGNDSHGRFIKKVLEQEGINADCVSTDNQYATGFQLKSKVEDGSDPIVEYFRKGSAASHLSICDFNEGYFASAKHLHLSGVAAALSTTSYELSSHLANFMHQTGKTVSFDPNLRPSLWKSKPEMVEKINQLAFKADWVLPGISEGLILTGFDQPEAIADFYLNKGVKLVVIKTGSDGAYYKNSLGDTGTVPAFFVENVVDTVGAGDGFAVGVLSALLEGKSIEQALTRGNRIGSLAIQVIGDSEGLPNREQLGHY